MIKKLLRKIELVFAVVAFTLIIALFLNPPTDIDGGPMMAYNFLFFFPTLLIAGFVALISLIISINRITSKKPNQKVFPILSILISIPVLLYFIVMASRILFPKPNPELEKMLADMDKPDEVYNNSIGISLESGKTIYLIGFNWGTDYQKRRVYISLDQYTNEEFQGSEAYYCQGDKDFDLFYNKSSDSIFVYIPDKEPMYHYIHAKRIEEIPVRAIQLDESRLDSLGNLMRFIEWK